MPGCAATKDAPVAPSTSARRPLPRGVSARVLAWIGVHLRVGVPRRITRTAEPPLTQKALPLSPLPSIRVRPGVAWIARWHAPLTVAGVAGGGPPVSSPGGGPPPPATP